MKTTNLTKKTAYAAILVAVAVAGSVISFPVAGSILAFALLTLLRKNHVLSQIQIHE